MSESWENEHWYARELHDWEIWYEYDGKHLVSSQMSGTTSNALDIMKKMSKEDGTRLVCKAKLYQMSCKDAKAALKAIRGH